MNVEVKVSINLDRALRRRGGPAEAQLRERGERVARRARDLAPGSMARGITMHMEGTARGMAAVVTSTHPASTYVINGTKPHLIRPRRAKALRFQAGGRTVFAAHARHPGTKPFPFLKIAARDVL
ncbi:hypothetical protein [Streptomyces sp. AD55]|uniref:hypothetical protein n=1 Tax=Streptomyces sp. AD55 TaxID=3242895 RepID=UPI003528887F